MEKYIIIVILITTIIYILLEKQFDKLEKETSKPLNISKDWNKTEEDTIKKALSYIKKYPYQSITSDIKKDITILITLLMKESGSKILNTPNNLIVGDKNLPKKAIGYFQIREPALLDTIKKFNQNFNESHLYNEGINLLIASRYFYLCFKENNDGKNYYEKLWLSAKRYNGGRDETLNSNNPRAIKYANDFIKLYSKVENVNRQLNLW